MVDHERSSLRHFLLKPSSLGGTSVVQNLHLPSESTGTHLSATCACIKPNGSGSHKYQTHHLMRSSEGTKISGQTPEFIICVDISSSKECEFSANESQPPLAAWTMLQRSLSATRLLNDVNINRHAQMHYGTSMATTNLGFGVL